MILYRIAKNLLRREHGKDSVQLIPLWDRKGMDGIHSGGVGAYFDIQAGVPSTWGNQLNWATWGEGTHPLHPFGYVRKLVLIMFGGIFGFDIDRKFSFNHQLLFKLFFTGL